MLQSFYFVHCVFEKEFHSIAIGLLSGSRVSWTRMMMMAGTRKLNSPLKRHGTKGEIQRRSTILPSIPLPSLPKHFPSPERQIKKSLLVDLLDWFPVIFIIPLSLLYRWKERKFVSFLFRKEKIVVSHKIKTLII